MEIEDVPLSAEEIRDIKITLLGDKDGKVYFYHTNLERITENDLDCLEDALYELRLDLREQRKSKFKVVK